MALRDLVPSFSIGEWIFRGVLAVVVVFTVASALGFRFDPFNLTAKRADRAEAKAEVAQDDAAARSIEVKGAAETAAQVEAGRAVVRSAEQAVIRQSATAEADPDAQVPLPPSLADRLHDGDRELCRLRPVLAGCSDSAAP